LTLLSVCLRKGARFKLRSWSRYDNDIRSGSFRVSVGWNGGWRSNGPGDRSCLPHQTKRGPIYRIRLMGCSFIDHSKHGAANRFSSQSETRTGRATRAMFKIVKRLDLGQECNDLPWKPKGIALANLQPAGRAIRPLRRAMGPRGDAALRDQAVTSFGLPTCQCRISSGTHTAYGILNRARPFTRSYDVSQTVSGPIRPWL
jgi:hypothetical protein